jgi:enoyl-CoA hydratase/carnithine racemase
VPSLAVDAPGDVLYRFEAPELKAANHRLDGALWPRGSEGGTAEQPVVLLEVQMQGKAGFKHRLWAQTARFAQLHPRVQHLEVVVVIPHRRLNLGPVTLPRVIGQGRASELLYTGRAMTGQEGLAWGFFNSLHTSADVGAAAQKMALQIAQGPSFAHGMTKTMLHQEWAMSLEQAIEAEAQAQAICMQTQDFTRAYKAFAAKEKPVFKGD